MKGQQVFAVLGWIGTREAHVLPVSLVVKSVVEEYVPLPHPGEESTQGQMDTVKRATASAASLHEAARGKVEALFESEEVRLGLASMCPSIALDELTSRFEKEFAAVEFVSNFKAAPQNINGLDNGDEMSLAMLEVDGYWANIWQTKWKGSDASASAYDLGIIDDEAATNCSFSTMVANNAETEQYGFPLFSSDCYPLTFDEASERPLYVAVNTLKIDVGNPTFGDVALVWKRTDFIDDNAILSDRDTGLYEFACDTTNLPRREPVLAPPPLNESDDDDDDDKKKGPIFFPKGNCEAGPPSNGTSGGFGTTSSFLHLVLGAQAWNNATTNWIVDNACRMLSSDDTPVSNTLTYWEAVVAKSAYVHKNVRFVLANFPSLFGNEEYGQRLRSLCLKHKWVLLWGFGANKEASYNRRLLDPLSASFLEKTHNNIDASAVFDLRWNAAVDDRQNKKWDDLNAFDDLKKALPIDNAVKPISARDNCRNLDSCVATVIATGRCLCYDDNIFYNIIPPIIHATAIA